MSEQKTPVYPASFYAKLFNLSERRIQQLAKDGVIPREGRGQYPLLGTIQGYVAYLQNKQLTSDDEGGLYQQYRARLVMAQADAQEMKNEVTRQKLAPIELLEFAMSKWSEQAKSLLNAIPLKVKKRLPHLKAMEVQTIQREIVKIQNSIHTIELDWTECPNLD